VGNTAACREVYLSCKRLGRGVAHQLRQSSYVHASYPGSAAEIRLSRENLSGKSSEPLTIGWLSGKLDMALPFSWGGWHVHVHSRQDRNRCSHSGLAHPVNSYDCCIDPNKPTDGSKEGGRCYSLASKAG
jgi:hypothetical protein